MDLNEGPPGSMYEWDCNRMVRVGLANELRKLLTI